nr:L-type lectin-domain containing receptor kinase IX.1-like [Ipomoea batatas]GMD09985.1 L-type lectin-domain containing receptor kinase IX.1-like [Ipomoea batatas]
MTGGDLDRRGKGEAVKNASGRGMILIERVRNHNIRHRSRTLWITNPTQIHLQHNLWNLNVLPTPERSCSAPEKLASRLVSDHDSVGLRHQTRRLPTISLRVELHEPGNRGDSATQGDFVLDDRAMVGGFLLLFLSIIPLVHSLSFNFDRFTAASAQNLTFERTAVVNRSIQLTSDRLASIGRATYGEPLHLWDKATGNLTAFNTHFAFVIDSKGSNRYGDGFAFFLAPVGSRIPPNATKGGGFGLANDDDRLNSSRNTFVAVEFDIYMNEEYDSQSKEVGIDVDSLKSAVSQTWFPDIEGGRPNEAWISYDPRSMNLSVVFTTLVNNRSVFDHLSYVVDLRKFLPEMVTFGFAGATGNRSALQKITSWNFTSTFDVSQIQANPERK